MSDDEGLNLRHIPKKSITPDAEIEKRPEQIGGGAGYGMEPIDAGGEGPPAGDDPNG